MGLFKRKNKEAKDKQSRSANNSPTGSILSSEQQAYHQYAAPPYGSSRYNNNSMRSTPLLGVPHDPNAAAAGGGYHSDDEACYNKRRKLKDKLFAKLGNCSSDSNEATCCNDYKCCGTYGTHACHINTSNQQQAYQQQQQQDDSVEVYHTTYVCYDPNCKGDSSCRHWSSSKNTGAAGAVAEPGAPGADYYRQAQLSQNACYNSGYGQGMGCGAVGYGGGGSAPAAARVYMGPAYVPLVARQPYLINRCPRPVLMGAVPVVVPTAGPQYGSANLVGAVPMFAVPQGVYPTVTTRPI